MVFTLFSIAAVITCAVAKVYKKNWNVCVAIKLIYIVVTYLK